MFLNTDYIRTRGRRRTKGNHTCRLSPSVYIYSQNFDHSAKTTLVRNAKPMNSKLKSYRYFFTSTLAIFRNGFIHKFNRNTAHQSGQQTQKKKKPWPSPPTFYITSPENYQLIANGRLSSSIWMVTSAAQGKSCVILYTLPSNETSQCVRRCKEASLSYFWKEELMVSSAQWYSWFTLPLFQQKLSSYVDLEQNQKNGIKTTLLFLESKGVLHCQFQIICISLWTILHVYICRNFLLVVC